MNSNEPPIRNIRHVVSGGHIHRSENENRNGDRRRSGAARRESELR
jgi:hypothetical protein